MNKNERKMEKQQKIDLFATILCLFLFFFGKFFFQTCISYVQTNIPKEIKEEFSQKYDTLIC